MLLPHWLLLREDRGGSSSGTSQKRTLLLLFSSEGLPEAPHPLSSFVPLSVCCLHKLRPAPQAEGKRSSSFSELLVKAIFLQAALAWGAIVYSLGVNKMER